MKTGNACFPPHGVGIATNKAQQVTVYRSMKRGRKESLSSQIIDNSESSPTTADSKAESKRCWRMAFMALTFFHLIMLKKLHIGKTAAGGDVSRVRPFGVLVRLRDTWQQSEE